MAVMLAAPGWAGVFGRVVPIGGNAADIVLDEPRGALYIANFTANRIEVMNTSDLTITRSINVDPRPGSIALSPDGRYLVVGHYDNVISSNGPDPIPQSNAITVLNLENNTRQTFAMGNSPLGIAFGADGLALILTASTRGESGEFFLFDPATGTFRLLDTVAGVIAKNLPQPAGTLPPSITTASITASGNRLFIHGLADSLQFVYDVQNRNLTFPALPTSPAPPVGPRVMSVSRDGYLAVAGWEATDYVRGVRYDFPNPGGFFSIGTHAIDSAAGVIYAQIPPAPPPPPPPTSQSACFPDGRCITETIPAPAGTPPSVQATPPNLMIVDADNLTVQQRLLIAESLGGRSVLNAAGTTLYSISESGVTVFPVGSALRTVPQVVASKEDVVFQINSCDRGTLTQTITIGDGGAHTDFRLSVFDPTQALAKAVTFSATSGMTPATVKVTIDPTQFQNQNGTTEVFIRVDSIHAANLQPLNCPTPASTSSWAAGCIRLLINSHEPDQRGAVVGVPGTLVDILPDQAHGRYYILRQDKNQVLVFDAATNVQTATLRTGNVPTQMALTRDGKYLLVGHNAAQYISVFDLDKLAADQPVIMPFGHYPRSVAASGRAILVASRVAGPKNLISTVDMGTRQATVLQTLGNFDNSINIDTVLVASANGSSILAAMPDGTALLYSAGADTFTIARTGLPSLAGTYAASSLDQFVIGNNVLNASLIPVGQLGAAGEVSSAFAFVVGEVGIRTSSTGPGVAGVIQKVDLNNIGVRLPPTRIAESPLVTSIASSLTSSAFSRTVAAILNQGTIVLLSQSGITILPVSYDAAVSTPQITAVLSAADRSPNVAAGGLVAVIGTDLSTVNVATGVLPMPLALAESCLVVNGVTIPLVLVSTTLINAQLPFNLAGKSQIVLRTPGGLSNNFNFNILATAPTVFRRTSAGGEGGSVWRAENNELVTDSNPIRGGDTLTIFATGLGRTSPAIEEGTAAPSDPLSWANVEPEVTLDGMRLTVAYAGLAPGEAGVYQINVSVPGGVRQGSGLPLTIRQGEMATTLGVEVAE
jgi:uncharacterized protein (TIGR03437 family)